MPAGPAGLGTLGAGAGKNHSVLLASLGLVVGTLWV